ncbi:MAG: 23S rRNA (pseudouridine(1915)-N(3))-methyltransferase RlmH [Oscillospiraceae bacterium]|nr:23S rRNA (pseudouridine(1915)-N(3))-methyltransferase RlmH [Oscillospiraceae bacterium]MBR2978008.1 23S rRNA (pseudouridine(1915)-N(3))-methyltransferase RlmH [Oscillospiraceae bacterium]
MFSITVIAVGKLKEAFYRDAAAEYEKRLGAYCSLRVIELPEQRLPDDPSPAQIAQSLEREATEAEKQIPKGAWVAVFTPEGKALSSPEFAEQLARVKSGGRSCACFLLGSSFGMAQRLKDRADARISMGKMTFPHHLARIMALEQLYRAESIQAGSRYHK